MAVCGQNERPKSPSGRSDGNAYTLIFCGSSLNAAATIPAFGEKTKLENSDRSATISRFAPWPFAERLARTESASVSGRDESDA